MKNDDLSEIVDILKRLEKKVDALTKAVGIPATILPRTFPYGKPEE